MGDTRGRDFPEATGVPQNAPPNFVVGDMPRSPCGVFATRDLIRQMSMANTLWGAPRIHGELLKLGIALSQATVGRYMP